jgi:hypothetical protein
MANTAPPAPPPVSLNDDGPLNRVRFRIWQIMMTAVIVLITGWFFYLNVVAGIIALFLAKHLLVAVLAMGLRLPHRPR